MLAILVGCLIALVAFKIFRRLFKEFSDASVALLLERRYPKELGDRLITAVELADPKLCRKIRLLPGDGGYHYSRRRRARREIARP